VEVEVERWEATMTVEAREWSVECARGRQMNGTVR